MKIIKQWIIQSLFQYWIFPLNSLATTKMLRIALFQDDVSYICSDIDTKNWVFVTHV